jgi:hypothetical protein
MVCARTSLRDEKSRRCISFTRKVEPVTTCQESEYYISCPEGVGGTSLVTLHVSASEAVACHEGIAMSSANAEHA